jgi:hypothetical protein
MLTHFAALEPLHQDTVRKCVRWKPVRPLSLSGWIVVGGMFWRRGVDSMGMAVGGGCVTCGCSATVTQPLASTDLIVFTNGRPKCAIVIDNV